MKLCGIRQNLNEARGAFIRIIFANNRKSENTCRTINFRITTDNTKWLRVTDNDSADYKQGSIA